MTLANFISCVTSLQVSTQHILALAINLYHCSHITYHICHSYSPTTIFGNLILLQHNQDTCESALCQSKGPSLTRQLTSHTNKITFWAFSNTAHARTPTKCSNNSSPGLLWLNSWVIAVIIWVAHIIEEMWVRCVWMCVFSVEWLVLIQCCSGREKDCASIDDYNSSIFNSNLLFLIWRQKHHWKAVEKYNKSSAIWQNT